ncbi:MAG: ATP synthase subunit I [Gemmatimonadota bacterium]
MTPVVLGLAGGLAVGFVYFGALWVTVRRIPDARHPGSLLLASYAARLALAAAGFYGILRLGELPALLAALLGFLAMRYVLMRRVRGGLESDPRREEAS